MHHNVSSFPSQFDHERSTRLADLEPWMDDQYALRLAEVMERPPMHVRIPSPPPDATAFPTGRAEKSPSLSESTPAQSRPGQTPKGAFTPSISPQPAGPAGLGTRLSTPLNSGDAGIPPQSLSHPHSQRGGEYSIFVGDLAPDVTHADIIAVFRDPTKGLRPDRGPPRKIKPFISCKTAKIMVDPSTGLSRGYGFIRFTDEVDQRRALIEMQGLYCLSRPSE